MIKWSIDKYDGYTEAFKMEMDINIYKNLIIYKDWKNVLWYDSRLSAVENGWWQM